MKLADKHPAGRDWHPPTSSAGSSGTRGLPTPCPSVLLKPLALASRAVLNEAWAVAKHPTLPGLAGPPAENCLARGAGTPRTPANGAPRLLVKHFQRRETRTWSREGSGRKGTLEGAGDEEELSRDGLRQCQQG